MLVICLGACWEVRPGPSWRCTLVPPLFIQLGGCRFSVAPPSFFSQLFVVHTLYVACSEQRWSCLSSDFMGSIISIDRGKAFDKMPTPFHDKNIQQIRSRRELSEHDKGIYEKSTANILNSERLKTVLKMGNKTRVPLWPLLCNIVLEILPRAIRREKVKGI